MSSLNYAGYVRISLGRDGKLFEHRIEVEKSLGRKLRAREVVHHLNGNRSDNRLENLEVYPSHSAHMRARHKPAVWVNWSLYKIPKKVSRWHPTSGKKCLISGCKRKTLYRSLCSGHYQSYWKHFLCV